MDNKIHKTTLDEAYDRWNQHFGRNEVHMFWKFLGVAPYGYARDDRWPYVHLSTDAIRKLELLLGPNHIALIKAYRARTLSEKKLKK